MEDQLDQQYSPGPCRRTQDAEPHVVGRYSKRRLGEDGTPAPQKIEVECTVCGAKARYTCHQGQPRRWISTFGQQHLHRSPLKSVVQRNRP